MLKRPCLYLIGLLLCSAVYPQATFKWNTIVVAAPNDGLVMLGNGRTVACGDLGLLAKLCPLLEPGDGVGFSGQLATVDSDLGFLGAEPASTLSVVDSGSPLTIFGSTFDFDGCILAIAPSGTGQLITLESTQTVRQVFCGPDGVLGRLCRSLLVADCGLFSGRFPAPGEDLFSLGLLDLTGLTADATEMAAANPGSCLDCDGRTSYIPVPSGSGTLSIADGPGGFAVGLAFLAEFARISAILIPDLN